MAPTVLTAAQGGFESARRLSPAQALTGHGFSAQVAAALPAGWGGFAGGEVPALVRQLQDVLRQLDGQLLNDRLPQPDDAALAAWIAARLDLPVPARVSVQSNAREGADRLPAAGPAAAEVQRWRRFRFQSAHRLPHVPPGHKCGRMHGHGFEAVVHAAVDDAQSIDEAWAPLHMQLNYCCLNDIEGLHNPTSEVLAGWLWQRLLPRLPGLRGVTVFETASCGAHVDGLSHRIWKDFSFDSATRLRHAPATDPRAGLHGHTYTLRLHLQAPLDPHLGWAVDFGEVKQAFKPVFDAIDHQSLDSLPGLADGDCASLARWIHGQARPLLPALQRVDLFETPGCGSLLLPDSAEVPVLPLSA